MGKKKLIVTVFCLLLVFGAMPRRAYASTWVGGPYDSAIDAALGYLGYSTDDVPQSVMTAIYNNAYGDFDYFVNTLSTSALDSTIYYSSATGMSFVGLVDNARSDIHDAIADYYKSNTSNDDTTINGDDNKVYGVTETLTLLAGNDGYPANITVTFTQANALTMLNNWAAGYKSCLVYCATVPAQNAAGTMTFGLIRSSSDIGLEYSNVGQANNNNIYRLNYSGNASTYTFGNDWNGGNVQIGSAYGGSSLSKYTNYYAIYTNIVQGPPAPTNPVTTMPYNPDAPTAPELPDPQNPQYDTPTYNTTNYTTNNYTNVSNTTTVDLQPILDQLKVINDNVTDGFGVMDSDLDKISGNLVVGFGAVTAALGVSTASLNANITNWGTVMVGELDAVNSYLYQFGSMLTNLNRDMNTWLQMIYNKLPDDGWEFPDVGGDGTGYDDSDLLAQLETMDGHITSGASSIVSAINGLDFGFEPFDDTDVIAEINDLTGEVQAMDGHLVSGLQSVVAAINGLSFTDDDDSQVLAAIAGLDYDLIALSTSMDTGFGNVHTDLVGFKTSMETWLDSLYVMLDGWLSDIYDRLEGYSGTYDPVIDPGNTPQTQMQADYSKLMRKFPFSVPWDLLVLLHALDAPAAAPVFDWPVPYMGDVHIDLNVYNDIAAVSRATTLWAFAWFLLRKTKELITLNMLPTAGNVLST